MSGKELKQFLKFHNIEQKELALNLGLKNAQALESKLKGKNMKDDFIKQIEKIIGFEIVPISENLSVPYTIYKELLEDRDNLLKKITILEYRLQKYEETEKRNVG